MTAPRLVCFRPGRALPVVHKLVKKKVAMPVHISFTVPRYLRGFLLAMISWIFPFSLEIRHNFGKYSTYSVICIELSIRRTGTETSICSLPDSDPSNASREPLIFLTSICRRRSCSSAFCILHPLGLRETSNRFTKSHWTELVFFFTWLKASI